MRSRYVYCPFCGRGVLVHIGAKAILCQGNYDEAHIDIKKFYIVWKDDVGYTCVSAKAARKMSEEIAGERDSK